MIVPTCAQIKLILIFTKQLNKIKLHYGRFAVVPYTIERVPSIREARSIEDGRHRNKMKAKQRNWEIDWIMMT
jgi:hypothetical protein